MFGQEAPRQERLGNNPPDAVITPGELLANDERTPPGYEMFKKTVKLPGGATETAYCVVRADRRVDPQATGNIAPSLQAGFEWVLMADRFQEGDGELQNPKTDDRALEIGNMCSYAMSQGLSEAEIDACYQAAYDRVREQLQV